MEEFETIKNSIYTKQLISLIKKGLISFCIIVVTMWLISKYIIRHLINYYSINITTINITESLDIQIAFTLMSALILSIPMILNIITYFLEIKANKKIWISFILAISGLIIGLTIMSKNIILGLNQEAIIQGTYSLKNILTFGMSIGFVTALSMQLILLIPLLNQLNLIDIKKYNPLILIVVTYFICAWITPTDLTSTLITMIPMNISMFLGVKLSKTNKCEVEQKC